MTELRRLKLSADLTNLNAFRDVVEETCQYFRMSEEMAYGVILAVDEAIANAILHGYDGQQGEIELVINKLQEGLQFIITDQAKPFNPIERPMPDLNKPLEERQIGGLGIYLIRRNMSEVHYRALPAGGNELTLVKYLHQPGE